MVAMRRRPSTLDPLLVLITLFQLTFSFVPQSPRHPLTSVKSNDKLSYKKENFYNDFEDWDSTDDSSSSFFDDDWQQHFQSIQKEQNERQENILENQHSGNWKVRGFQIFDVDIMSNNNHEDPTKEEEDKVSISACRVHEDILWLGRSNGSLLAVHLSGNEYFTTFTTQNQTLIRESSSTNNNAHGPQLEMVHQISLLDHSIRGGIQHLLCETEDLAWVITDQGTLVRVILDDHDKEEVEANRPSQGTAVVVADHDAVVALVSLDGTVAVVTTSTVFTYDSHGKLKDSFASHGSSHSDITSVAATANTLYLGFESGEISLLTDKGELLNQWQAFEHAVTCLHVCEDATSKLQKNETTTMLWCGSQQGRIQRYEMIQQKQPWPRMASQRLGRAAHVFDGHDSAVTSLLPVHDEILMSGDASGMVRAWNDVGNTLYLLPDIHLMDWYQGSLVAPTTTNAVCLHDFDVEDFQVDDRDLQGGE